MNKALVIGANGQLGSDLMKSFSTKYDVIGVTHSEIEVADINSVKKIIEDIKPFVVLNTAAYHNVPTCEINPEKSYAVNAFGALNVAKVAESLSAINIYYSTDYIFDGYKLNPYFESDLPNPLNIYGNSKLAGEFNTLNYSSKSYVLRISGIYGKVVCRAKGKNFVTTMLNLSKNKDILKVVDDEILTPTSTQEIADKTVELLSSDNFGLYHFTAEGACSWYDFAVKIFDVLGIKISVERAKSADFDNSVKRPLYSVLENRKYNEMSLSKFSEWDFALEMFLKENYL